MMACCLYGANHYLNQCWIIVNQTTGNKFQWNFNQNQNILIEKTPLKMPSVKWLTFCLGLNVLIRSMAMTQCIGYWITSSPWVNIFPQNSQQLETTKLTMTLHPSCPPPPAPFVLTQTNWSSFPLKTTTSAVIQANDADNTKHLIMYRWSDARL